MVSKKMEKQVKFNKEKHTYKYGSQKLTPVTDVLKMFFGEVVSKDLARKVNKIPKSPYYKRGIKNILAEWKAKTEAGTLVHKQIEDYVTLGLTPKHPKALQAKKFLETEIKTMGIFLLLPEQIVHNTDYAIAGTIDLIIVDYDNDCITLVDWKTNEKVSDIQYEPMKIPIEGLRNSTLCKFQMQLSIYAHLLRLNNHKIKSLKLVHLGEENTNIYILPFLEDIARNMCETHKEMKKHENKYNEKRNGKTVSPKINNNS